MVIETLATEQRLSTLLFRRKRFGFAETHALRLVGFGNHVTSTMPAKHVGMAERLQQSNVSLGTQPPDPLYRDRVHACPVAA